MSSLSDDPRLVALLDTTTRITGPGMPFEIVEEDVLGERLPVFANRAHSMREILLGASRFGERDCYVFGDGYRLTFDQLIPQVASLATALRDRHGIGPGDRVAVCAANNREWLMTFWAVAALDAVLDRIPSMRLADGYRYERVQFFMMRGPTRVDVVF